MHGAAAAAQQFHRRCIRQTVPGDASGEPHNHCNPNVDIVPGGNATVNITSYDLKSGAAATSEHGATKTQETC
jgi:hypothetical protein